MRCTIIVLNFAYLLFFTYSVSAQLDYDSLARAIDPRASEENTEENMRKLDSFLYYAQNSDSPFNHVHAYLFLGDEEMIHGNFESSYRYLATADSIANYHQSPLLSGRALHEKGTLSIFLKDYDKAINLFEEAIEKHILAADSQRLCLTLEQLAAAHGYQGDYAQSKKYYQEAFPLIERHGTKRQLAVSYTNLGNVLSYQDSILKAISCYQKSLDISQEINDDYLGVASMQNLAGEYIKINRPEEALGLLHNCVTLNKKYGWNHFITYTYQELFRLHKSIGQSDSALFYLEKHHVIEDSLAKVETQLRIEQMENERSQAIAEAEALNLENQVIRKSRNIRSLLLFSLLLLLSGILIINRKNQQRKALKQKIIKSKESLLELTEKLRAQNSLQHKTKSEKAKDLKTLDLQILTKEDWQEFKQQFDLLHPGLLLKIREEFSGITEAEERLFLFIKLNLNSQEISTILGIKSDSVKKTRVRLRKRLGINSHTSLREFIQKYE